MTLMQLQYFVMVVESGSYSLAAEKMFTSQSSVSKQILSMEKELNTRLFDRTHRKIALTGQGQIVYSYAKDILKEYDGLITELDEYNN